MDYEKYFDIGGAAPRKKVRLPTDEGGLARGDRRDGRVYVYDERIELAVNVALATGRPMLVRGPSGCGKSSLARNVAARLGWRYYEQVVTSRTQARDLQWTFDAVRRLGDAQARRLDPDPAHYVEPGVLWWAFDPASAERRGRPIENKDGVKIEITDAPADPGVGPEGEGAVVLLDEIDKADPDVPNNLLVPLGSFQFPVRDRENDEPVIATRPVMIVITTNDERVLPAAFMRRCVVHELKAPTVPLLVRIARQHYGPDKKRIYRPIAQRVVEISKAAAESARGAATQEQEAGASTAEYLDTVAACLELEIEPSDDDAAWKALTEATLAKSQNPL